MNPCKAVCFLAVVLIASAPLALAQGTYTQIDYPGSTSTYVGGINTGGDISGSYADANKNWHGFVLFSGGTYITIDYPSAQETYVQGINNSGQIVGYTGSNTSFFSFVYDLQRQTFSQISYPGATETIALSINDSGALVGWFVIPNDQYLQGFELVGSNYIRIVPPGEPGSVVTGISNPGELVGFLDTKTGALVNFSSNSGRYRRIPIQDARAEVFGTSPSGTAIVGSYPTSAGTAAFLGQNKVLQTLRFPGANSTNAYGVSYFGDVVGYFIDQNGTQHGFLWTPPAAAAKK
jgi:probable HAF family extracellular repeat protein